MKLWLSLLLIIIQGIILQQYCDKEKTYFCPGGYTCCHLYDGSYKCCLKYHACVGDGRCVVWRNLRNIEEYEGFSPIESDE